MEDDFDNDDDEMKRLRQSRNYKVPPRTGSTEKKPQPKPDNKIQAKQASVEDDEPLILNDEDLSKFNLPTSFGANKGNKNTTQFMEKSKRAPGPVAPGPRKPVGPSRPTQPEPSTADDNSDDDAMIGPPRPPPTDAQDDDEDMSEQQVLNFYKIPYSHEIHLAEHTRIVSAIDVDRAGGRVVTGGFDYQMKFWDFVGMDASLKSFRTIEPVEGNQINSLQFSNTSDRVLVAAANSQAKIYSRDGIQLAECIKGDVYLTDMANTKGHISTLGNAAWDPTNHDIFVTSSLDGTVRIWDANTMEKKQKTVMKAKSTAGRRIGITWSTFSTDGKLVAAGCQDGSIQLWSTKGPFSRPSEVMRGAHKDNMDITCLQFSSDGFTLLSRGMDDTLKVWDVRNTRKALAEFDDLPNFGETKCIFSPDDRLILTGTSVSAKGEESGLLVFFDKTLLKRVKQIGVSPGHSVVSMAWHKDINQLLVGTSSGKVHVYYDPDLSKKGALMSVVKEPRKVDPFDYEPQRPILTPHALPQFAETLNSKRKAARERYDPRKTAKPDPTPLEAGPGHNGKIGNSVTQILLKNYVKKDFSGQEDPREAILKYAKEAEENPVFFGAYKETQPDAIFDYSEAPELGRVKLNKDKKKQ